MKIYQTTLLIGYGCRKPGQFWRMFTKKPPTWTLMRRYLATQIAEVNARMLRDDENDYDSMAKRRKWLQQILKAVPCHDPEFDGHLLKLDDCTLEVFEAEVI